MPRLREHAWRYLSDVHHATFELMMGPTDAPNEFSVEELAIVCGVERDRPRYGSGPMGS